MKNTHEPASPLALNINLTAIPPLLDVEGINTYLAPISRSTLYSLASEGLIESASIGLGRGRRCFTTASVAAWLQQRAATTKRPNIAPRKAADAKSAGASQAKSN